MLGTLVGSYELHVETQNPSSSIVQTGNIVQDATYVYIVNFGAEVVTVKLDPVKELKHLKEFIMNLPNDVFVTDDPDEFVEFKKEMIDKIHETFEELYEIKYMEAVEKLNDMKEEVIEEDKLQLTTQSDLCVIIDHIISSFTYRFYLKAARMYTTTRVFYAEKVNL